MEGLRTMNKKKLTALLIIAAAAIIGIIAIIILMIRSNNPPVSGDEKPQVAYISITDQGFVPAELKITRGMSVVWRNETTAPHQIASNPYPERSDLPGLNAQNHLLPQSEYSYTFAETGTFGYHDYLNPTINGMVTVVEKE